MKYTIVFAAGVLAILATSRMFAASPKAATRPTAGGVINPATLQMTADAAFDRNEYSTALALYVKVSKDLAGQPDKLRAIQGRIDACQKEIAASAPVPGLTAAQGPQVKTSLEERKPHERPRDGQALDCAIKELGNFEYDAEKGGNLPPDILKLDGVEFRTRGYMMPLDAADQITEFALVPSLFSCCFGQPPQVQHTIIVHTPKGKAVAYFPEQITVQGTLKVSEKKENGWIVSIFEIQCTSVKPAPK